MSDTLSELVATSSLIVTCGPGGVGKTTTAAAIGLIGARDGRRVVVVTIDPARRLADALGLDRTATDEPHRVKGLGKLSGSLDVLMLDAERTFDRMITDRAGARADAILNNRIYRSIAGSLSGAQEYMAIERLHQLHDAGTHDLIVVDTPPSRHAIDILSAPDRLTAFFSHPVYRALTMPGRSMARVTSTAATAFSWTVKRLAGPRIVEDTVELFRSMSGIEDGLRQRAVEVSALLRQEGTSFVLVSSPRAEAIDEAQHLADALQDGGYRLNAVIANLLHPLPAPCDIGDAMAPPGSALADQLEHHAQLTTLATAERDELQALWATIDGDAQSAVRREVPLLEHDVHALDTLAEIADALTAIR
ncbi:MAG: putative anion transporting ATPase [Ilumatobacteraceae bacterium]|nr:putative anion transporting ATPase [Ilumatobacteraceae bacterium]